MGRRISAISPSIQKASANYYGFEEVKISLGFIDVPPSFAIFPLVPWLVPKVVIFPIDNNGNAIDDPTFFVDVQK